MLDKALPASARFKLTAIRQAFADAQALNAAGMKSINHHRERENHLLSTLQRLTSGTERDLKEIDAAESELKAVRAEIERISQQTANRQGRMQATGDLVRSIENWLKRQGPDAQFRAVPVKVPPDAAKNLPAAIAAKRAAIDEAQGELARIRRAPRTAAELKADIRQRIAAMAEKGRARVYGAAQGELRIDLMPSTLAGDTLGQMFNRPVVENMMAWLHRDALIKALEAEIDAAELSGAVSAEDKARAEQELPPKILLLEREEEALIEAALDTGLPVERRGSVSPAAILGVEVARQDAEVAA